MNVAQHAGRILAAWNIADSAGFEQELENALRSCQRPGPVNYLEFEQREVLESVVEQLRSMHTPTRPAAARGRLEPAGVSKARRSAPQCVYVGFALLEHLCQRAA